MHRAAVNAHLRKARETYVLIDWVGENTSSVLQGVKVAGGGFSVGEVSPIRIGTETYDGLVVASATKDEMEKMLREKDGDMCGRHELSETGEGKGGESETGEGKGGESETGEGKGGESETGEGKGGESETGEGKGGEREKGESETGEGKGGESETGEGKGGERETGEKKGRKKRKQQQQGRIATSKKRKEGSIISISDHGGCAPTFENNSGPDLVGIKENISKLVNIMTTVQNTQQTILDRLTSLEKGYTEHTTTTQSPPPTPQEHEQDNTQFNTQDIQQFLSDDFDLTTLLETVTDNDTFPLSVLTTNTDATEFAHTPSPLPPTSSIHTPSSIPPTSSIHTPSSLVPTSIPTTSSLPPTSIHTLPPTSSIPTTSSLPPTSIHTPSPLPPTSSIPTTSSLPPTSIYTENNYKPLPLLYKLRNTQYRLRPTDTQNLDTLESILDRYSTYTQRGDDGLLALILAREAVFGGEVMAKCTPLGTKTKMALPQRELFTIKRAIFKCHPEFWTTPESFEGLWKRCHTAIQQGCGRQSRRN